MTDESLLIGKIGLPFRSEDGTFAYTKGSYQAVPTHEPGVNRLYVKLRRQHVRTISVAGGLYTATKGDIFMLKTILDSLAGVRSESDPTVGKLEAGEWESDVRDQLTQHVSEPFIIVLPGPYVRVCYNNSLLIVYHSVWRQD
jgi:hypothetical protein